MDFSSHKWISRVSDSVIVTGFQKYLKYTLHLPRNVLLIAEQDTTSFRLRWIYCNIIYESFAVKTADGLSWHFVGLWSIEIQFMSEFSQHCVLEFLTVGAANVCTSAYRESVADPGGEVWGNCTQNVWGAPLNGALFI